MPSRSCPPPPSTRKPSAVNRIFFPIVRAFWTELHSTGGGNGMCRFKKSCKINVAARESTIPLARISRRRCLGMLDSASCEVRRSSTRCTGNANSARNRDATASTSFAFGPTESSMFNGQPITRSVARRCLAALTKASQRLPTSVSRIAGSGVATPRSSPKLKPIRFEPKSIPKQRIRPELGGT